MLLGDVDSLLDARIVIAGQSASDVEFMKTLLQISGFSQLIACFDKEEVLQTLRQGIVEKQCDIDLLIIDSQLPELCVSELRTMMDEFDEWRLIPIISLIQESQWNHAQLISDLGHGITPLFYHPLTAENFPPAVMTALAVKKDRDQTYQKVVQLEDEVARLKVMEARLQFSVGHDDLTGLLNRRELEHILGLALTQIRNFSRTAALFYVDVDRFKVLNDAVGHEVGDGFLVQIANELRRFFSVNDAIVRIGSDEFAILVEDIDRDTAIKQAEVLCSLFDGYDFEHNAHHYHLSVSIGVKILDSQEVLSAGDALAQANQACYTAKKRGRNRINIYCDQDNEMQTLRYNVEWTPHIRTALQQEKFFLEFQPIFSLASKRISHYECLLRMKKEGKIYYPDTFIPVAETMGLITHIDLWVVNHVFDLIRSFPNDISLTINLSSNIFLDRSLYLLIKQKLAETAVDPNRIIFEITETAAISNFEQTKKMILKIRELGCRFALDDFGAGFNSYNYLKQIPVDILKIDGSFVTNLARDTVDQRLVKSMIDIAHDLGKTIVAEFVEDEATKDLLAVYGIDYVQGYLIGKPSRNIMSSAA